MKSKFAPGTEWANTVLDRQWSKSYDQTNGKNQSNSFRDCRDGLVSGFECIYDPDIKSQERTHAKATFKYKNEKTGKTDWCKMRDLSRFALQYENAENLVKGIETVKEMFDVIEIENRFMKPTPLGWSDISMLVKAPIENSFHVVELQL